MVGVEVEARVAALAEDRVHGAGWLARAALGVLAAVPGAERSALAARLAVLRPEMPAIAAAVAEAAAAGDVRTVLRRADKQRRRVSAEAARRLAGGVVVTLSNSSLVARTLILAVPRRIDVLVEDAADEGHCLLSELVAAGLAARAVGSVAADVDSGVLGCDAVFDDGGIVNRRGSAALVARMDPRPVLVLGELWKIVGGVTPASWPRPELFEPVRPHPCLVVVR